MLWVIRVLAATRVLMGFEFRREKVTPLLPEEVPAHLREGAQPWIKQLEEFGFHLLGAWRTRWEGESAFDEENIILLHSTQPIRAVVRPHVESSRSGEFWIELRTTTAEGVEIVTASCAVEQLAAPPPGLELEVVSGPTVQELLARHKARASTAASDAWFCGDLAGAAQREQYLCDGRFEHLRTSGLVTERAGGGLTYRALPALKRAVHLLRLAAKQKKLSPASPVSPLLALKDESLVPFDLRHYRQMIALSQGRFSLRTKTAITVVSFLLFTAALAWQMSPVVAATLLIALVVHECGHLLGMRWFGYRDTQLLFVPFFGGAAVGHDDKVLRPWQHIVIILLGPLPGIFAGLALLTYQLGGGGPEWLLQAALTTLVMNAFNLLPILPLDGGQIVDFAVASRFPRSRVLFIAASAAGLLLVGLWLDGVQILVVLAVFTILQLPLEWRLAEVRREVRGVFPEGGEEEPIVRRLLEHMRQPEWKKTSSTRRLQAVRGLQRELRMPRPGFGTLCFAVAGYTSPLWLGLPAALWFSNHQGDALAERAEAGARAAGLIDPIATTRADSVPAEDDAGALYRQAEALLTGEAKEQVDPAKEAQAVALLRAASRKKIFVPPPDTETEHRSKWILQWSRGSAVDSLTGAAEEKLRNQEPADAIALAVDALRLVRLVDSAPGWWRWEIHQRHRSAAWSAIETALASGTKLTPAMKTELLSMAEETPEIAFAAAAIPRGLVRQAQISDLELPDSEDHVTWLMHKAARSLSPSSGKMKAESFNQAVVAHNYLQAIQRGQWPERPVDEEATTLSLDQVEMLGDQIARLRLAKVALAIIGQRQKGLTVDSLATLAHPAADLEHPYTRKPMRMIRREQIDVLTFAADTPDVSDATEAEDDLSWRLPPKP